MANGQHGGYRRPTSPAPVSGPGALSRRTDGTQPRMDLPNAGYGENAAYQAAQAAAPMSQSDSTQGGQGGFQGVDTSGLTPLGAPSARPDEPITAGLSGGNGGGPYTPQGPRDLDADQQSRLKSYLPVLINLASQQDVDPNTRAYVTRLRAELG